MTPAETLKKARRARKTIWRLFERRHIRANVATARLLTVDLATGHPAPRPKRH